MATIHDTTMSPSKYELLAAWLPSQPWYVATGQAPELTRAGGFRLDDPDGEVGIEFMVVTDGPGDAATTYLVPMTYRGQALADADGALIGRAEHGVLGQRWIYDGPQDPVLAAQLAALIHGTAEPQAQSDSDTPDPTVTVSPVAGGLPALTASVATSSVPSGTEVRIGVTGADGAPGGALTVRLNRVLRPDTTAPGGDAGAYVSATWRLPDHTQARGIFATAG